MSLLIVFILLWLPYVLHELVLAGFRSELLADIFGWLGIFLWATAVWFDSRERGQSE